MKLTPAGKCQQCSAFHEVGGFCSHLDAEELESLSAESRSVMLRRGDTIDSNELNTWPVLLIATGILSMQHLLEDGRKTIAAFFMQGDIIDMRNMPARHRGSLIALGKSKICRLSPKVFGDILEKNPSAQRVVWENLRTQTYRAMEHSADLAKKQALEKLASFIFECQHRQIITVSKNSVTIPVRRIDLAEYLGMQPETVSRGFKELEERGILEFQNTLSLKILNAPALRRIANGDRSSDHMPTAGERRFKVLSFG